MNEMKLIHKGSTKDVHLCDDHYVFRFSDRYSVFDWGEMPDLIPGKGIALAGFTKKIYRYFETCGIKTHLLSDKKTGPNEIAVKPYEVIRENLGSPMPRKSNIFIPLEVIFRMGVAKGSSLLKRYKSEKDWKQAGLDRVYQEGEFFLEPIIEFTTKLERFDRPLTHAEARTLACMNEGEWQDLLTATKNIALELNSIFSHPGIKLWDGKVEFAFGEFKGDKREIILVDSIGPDELRLSKDGAQLSKEIIRQYYRNTPWYETLDEMKLKHGEKFKDFIKPPEKLPEPFFTHVAHMYGLLTELILNEQPDFDKFSKLIQDLKRESGINVLVLGSGGREHALAWRLAQDQSCRNVFIWPGNGGMEHSKFNFIQDDFSQDNLKYKLDEYKIDLVLPGAEKYLFEGVADWCTEWNVACFGPSKSAARLEGSKLFAKGLMTEAGIGTSKFADITRTSLAINEFTRPVIKISGPSLGKGVFVCANPQEANEIILKIKSTKMPGLEDGILVEEGVTGKEISVFYACNGVDYKFLGAAQDHKRLLDEDLGPNTGGMGAVSPVPWATAELLSEITTKFLVPTLISMNQRGDPFKGILFLGLMINEKEKNLLEYNVRFGDPETQVLMPLIEGNFTKVLYDLACGKKNKEDLKLNQHFAVHVVKAAKGYPGLFGNEIEKNKKIHGKISSSENSQFFYAGVKKKQDGLFTDGGRVLGLTTWDESPEGALKIAYSKLHDLSFEGEQFRRDIGRNS